MNQMIVDLNKVLAEKNFGDNEKSLILHVFEILQNHFRNQTHKLLEYIGNIKNLSSFKIVTDVNEDEYLTSKIRILDLMDIKIRERIPGYLSGCIIFRKDGDKYVLDQNGEYGLTLLGYCNNIEKSIAIFGLSDSNVETFLHEYEHTTQKGFKISAMYFASAELEFILREGDAMDLSLNALKEDKNLQKDILMNDISYFKEFHLFSNLKMLLGQEFIENWKSNTDIDFMEQIRKIFKDKFDENTLQELMAIMFLLKNFNSINNNALQSMLDNYKKGIKTFTESIETIKRENTEFDTEIEQLSKEIIEEENRLNNSNFVTREVNKEKAGYVEMIAEYTDILNSIKNCNGDKNKLKDFITSLGEEYDENMDYGLLAQEMISEYNEMLTSDHIEIQITRKLTSKIENLKFRQQELIKRKAYNQECMNTCISSCDTYNFSMNILSKVVQRISNYNNLNGEEKVCFNDNMLIEIQLIFNECLNKIIETSENPKSFLEDYSSLISSSFNIRKPLNNEESPVFNENTELLTRLNNSRLRTQALFMTKPINDEASTNQILFVHLLNQTKLPISSETITQEMAHEHKTL